MTGAHFSLTYCALYGNHTLELGDSPTVPPTASPAAVVGCLDAIAQEVALRWSPEPSSAVGPALAPHWAVGLGPVGAPTPPLPPRAGAPGPLPLANSICSAAGMPYVGEMSPILSPWQVHLLQWLSESPQMIHP